MVSFHEGFNPNIKLLNMVVDNKLFLLNFAFCVNTYLRFETPLSKGKQLLSLSGHRSTANFCFDINEVETNLVHHI